MLMWSRKIVIIRMSYTCVYRYIYYSPLCIPLYTWQAVRGYYWEQLCAFRCPEFHLICEDSGDWNLWECIRSLWSHCGHYHVIPGHLANSFSCLRDKLSFTNGISQSLCIFYLYFSSPGIWWWWLLEHILKLKMVLLRSSYPECEL